MSITSSISTGTISCITGPMFSGKTTRFLNLLSNYPEKEVILFKPSIDNRYKKEQICTHNGICRPALVISDEVDILTHSKNFSIIGIDEVQFFNRNLLDIINILKAEGKHIYLSGLEKDSNYETFGILESLSSISDNYSILSGTCDTCNNPSTHTFRINNVEGQVLVGEKDAYTALCKKCYDKKIHDKK